MLELSLLLVMLAVLAGFAREHRRLRRMPHLPATPATPDPAAPFVSVIVPARNEARCIARCLDGLVTQDYPHYEIIVIDDASTDATPAILADYAARHAHLRVLRTQGVPPGWTGKANACQQGAAAARGAWLLFLDADTVAAPTLLVALTQQAQRQQCDLLSVFPFLELGSFAERLVLPPFRAMIYATYPFGRANAPDSLPRDVLANGQCILVRTAAYRAIDGHAAVRAAVLEDVLLARAIRAAGWRTAVAYDNHHLRVRMYTGLHDVLEGLTKNAAAGFASGGTRSLWVGCWQFTLAYAPWWLLIAAGALWAQAAPFAPVLLAGAAGVLLVALAYWWASLRRLYRLPAGYALLWTFGLTIYGLIVVRSLWRVHRGQGVQWKGRTYAGT